MLVKWLGKGPSTLPPSATHAVGIGAWVLDGNGNVLVVRERRGPAAKRGNWKVPTGLVDAGEELADAAEREVQEETGIVAAAEGISCFGQIHGGQRQLGAKRSFFFMVRLRAKSIEIAADPLEIAEARWMPLEEFKSRPYPPPNSLYHEMTCVASQPRTMLARELSVGRGRGSGWLYSLDES
eukprot:NODE_14187_length_1123_cov_4.754016.p2 GENE.NODE_14187_length_1123_cov_4.754016~~NODE_14187_length_1123_cov_4.754016.p2  ORF type:complete len:182 (+),score=63.46 NODE_14187_length_1123_cov_4.754016:495-1040(+)